MGAVPGTYVHTADNAVPELGEEHAGLDDDLSGFHAGVDLVRDGLRLMCLDQLTPDQTQTLIAVLAGSSDGTDLLALLIATVVRLADADTNPCLRGLPDDRAKAIRLMGEQFAFLLDTAASAPRGLAAEICAAIEGI